MSQLNNQLAANILAGNNLTFKKDRPSNGGYLSKEYVQSGQLGVLVNIAGTRKSLFEKITNKSGLVLAPNTTSQELSTLLEEEIISYSNILSWVNDWEVFSGVEFIYPGQTLVPGKDLNKKGICLATVLTADLDEIKSSAARRLYKTPVQKLDSLEDIVSKFEERYHISEIINPGLLGVVKKIDSAPLEVAVNI